MKIFPISPQISNFQTGYIPESLLAGSDTATTSDVETFVALSLTPLKRRLLLRCSYPRVPEDVPQVIRCDIRVQQIENWKRNGRKETERGFSCASQKESSCSEERKCVHESGPGNRLNKGEKGARDVDGSERDDTSTTTGNNDNDHMDGVSQEDPTRILSSGSSGNDCKEIDLAHHVTEMEHMMSIGGGDVGVTRSGRLEVGDESLSLERLPSTVRFNDALACTSKDLEILKSGAIKMMRLTVICHSDLHYQNHTRKHHRNQRKSCFGNGATTAKETGPFPKSSSTPQTYSSTPSSMGKVNEKETGVCERGVGSTNQTLSLEYHHPEKEEKKSENSNNLPSTSSTHHDENDDEQFTSTGEQRDVVKPSLSSTLTTSKNWECLKGKIRNVFQAYNIQVGEGTIVSLKGCPLASIHHKFSPAALFVFVEECEMKESSQSVRTDIGRVTGKTEIIITNVHHISYYHRLVEKGSTRELHLFGLEVAAKILHSVIEMQRGEQQKESVARNCSVNVSSNGLTEFSHGLLISGPVGCGKVAVVREIAKKVGAHLLSFNPVGSVETNLAQFCQQLSKIFMSALMTASRYPTVLLLPRIHLLFHGSNSPSSANTFTSSSGQRSRERVLHHLCKLFDSIPVGLALTVVGTTDKTFLVPLQLRRAGRLEKEIIITPPKESERLKILQELTRNMSLFANVDLSDMASQTPGYVAQDLQKLIRLALFKCQEEDCSRVSEPHVRYSIGRVVPSVLQGALGVVDIQRAISLDHIAGLHSVKLDLIKAIVWPLKHPQSFLRMGISPPKGILLYGPPGNCKTTLVRAVAASHQTNFLSVSAAELFSSGVGDSEKIVTHLFHRARMASPCILFIDELEAIVGSRQNSEKKQTSTNESILSMLLTEMDGVGTSKSEGLGASCGETLSLGPLVLVVAATNRPDLIDPALLRPGRFDKLIGVPPLDVSGRKELLEVCSKSIPFHSDVKFCDVAEATEYYSGADLVNLCKEAAMYALSEDMSAPFVTSSHVKMALNTVGPSLNPRMIREFEEYGSSRRCSR